MKHFSFLIKEYGFKFDKIELGDLRDENGKLYAYEIFRFNQLVILATDSRH